MCASSMIMDHYQEKWSDRMLLPSGVPNPSSVTARLWPPTPIDPGEFFRLKAEVEEMKALLKRALEYDKRTGQPHCEVEDKVAFVKKVAEIVGVDLSELIK